MYLFCKQKTIRFNELQKMFFNKKSGTFNFSAFFVLKEKMAYTTTNSNSTADDNTSNNEYDAFDDATNNDSSSDS
ncbi:hypothetical protein F8M41_016753 [Gigaspora margarita]|uniref:Uncharacterized protein n=1 Tax=Gigaspora margarita TaxID=4874 RepID=A0A8H4B353_GIGMA|nr:hypothetical protein F8M41_016753 [Gigaspora margarita]